MDAKADLSLGWAHMQFRRFYHTLAHCFVFSGAASGPKDKIKAKTPPHKQF